MVFTFNAENPVSVCLQLIFEVDPGVGLVLYFSKHREKGRTIGQVCEETLTLILIRLIFGVPCPVVHI
jgi:hypothetical protein